MQTVLLVNKLFYPVYGGVETVVAQIAEGLASDPEYKVSILAGNEQANLFQKHYQWKGVDIYKTAGLGTLYNTALSPQYPFTLRSLLRKHDILHFHTPNPLSELSLLFNNIPANKKVIVSVHADVSQTQRKKYGGAYNYLLKRLLNRADIITTMSPQNRDGFPVLQSFLSKCRIVPNAYNAQHLVAVSKEDKKSFGASFNLDREKKTILYVGRLSEYKGLKYLIEAIQHIQNVQLLIVGDGASRQELERQASTLRLPVIFTGFLNGRNMACAYSMSDVFVLPSLTETFGIVQAEAMRFGLPVINTQLNTGVNYVSPHNLTGLTVEPANAPALSMAITTLLEDEASRKKFADAALLRSGLFTPDIMVDSFKKLYQEMSAAK